MSYTYAGLTTALQTILASDSATDTDFTTILPSIIQAGELRCYREVDFLVTRKADTGAFSNYAIVGASVAALWAGPSDLLVVRSFDYFTPAGTTTTRVNLQRRADTFLNDWAPVTGTVGAPRFYAATTTGTFRIAPTPDAAYTTELAYTYRPTALSASNTTTWLATNCPDLLLCACMVFASGYIRNFGSQSDDPAMAQSWESQYARAKDSAMVEEERRKSSGYFDLSPTQAKPSIA